MTVQEDNYRMGFWESCWTEDKSFWHKDQTHPILRKYEDKLIPSANNDTTVFFPLCGKTLDMRYFLEKGYNVLGIEGVESVVLEYFKENGISYEVVDITLNGSDLKVFVAGKLTIICGNCFITEPLPPTSGIPEYATRKVDAVFDRGSMVAILPTLRKDYIKFMQKWAKSGTKLLLHGPEYDQTLKEGPPFSVSYAQMKELYEGIADHEMLESIDNPSFGLEKTLYQAFLMTFH
jgi:thiopurine S-methyltransferase